MLNLGMHSVVEVIVVCGMLATLAICVRCWIPRISKPQDGRLPDMPTIPEPPTEVKRTAAWYGRSVSVPHEEDTAEIRKNYAEFLRRNLPCPLTGRVECDHEEKPAINEVSDPYWLEVTLPDGSSHPLPTIYFGKDNARRACVDCFSDAVHAVDIVHLTIKRLIVERYVVGGQRGKA